MGKPLRHQQRPVAVAGRKPAVIAGLGVDLPELQQARGLWQHNRFDEALELFGRAVKTHPQNLVALIDASRAFGARFEISRAEELLDRLTRLGSDRAEILHLAGQSYRMIFRPEKAMECFRRVVRITGRIPDAHLELAVLCERRHLVEEAFSLVEDCLNADPGYVAAELFKARLLRRRGDSEASETLLRALAANPGADPLIQAQAHAELAQAHDRRGDYDAAMSSMLTCKAILLRAEGPTRRESEAVIEQLGHIADEVSRADFERWAEAGRGFKPESTAVLAGFPRSGTTLLEQVLDSHPGVVSSDEREAFARDIFPALWLTATTRSPTVQALGAAPQEVLTAQRRRYLDYMSAALNQPIGGRVHLDKNPTLTLLLPALLRLFPEMRVLIALRDPRDVVLSCFMQYLPLNPNSVCFLTLERTAARYAHDMAAWRKFRERLASPWLEVRYEDCVSDLEAQARRALEFLGLPWDPEVMNYRERLKLKAVSSPTYEAVSRPVYGHAVGRWRHYEKYLAPCFETLRPSIAAFGY
jgi:thioredoxin-like negative regulator of GroEL